ncbi:MAG TPA: NADPH-dependent F420 reductase [Candidatus Limnocylindrales bacterium]
MNVAIIGAGNVGRALATSFTRAGHTVTIASHDPEHAAAAATATGAGFAKTNAEAAKAGEIVVLAIPFTSAEDVAAEIRDAVAGKTVVDVTNRMSFGPSGPTIDNGDSNSDRLAVLLPNARIVKAFNTVFASRQADPMADGTKLDGFVAGDDQGAKDTVLELVRSMGLNPVDVGPLARAQQLEQLAFLNIALNVTANGSWASGWRLVGAPVLAPVAA